MVVALALALSIVAPTAGTVTASASTVGESVTTIWTDFEGTWKSDAVATIPNSDQNLIAFTSNGVVYSTGVNDGLLSGVTFTPTVWGAFPVSGGLPVSSSLNYFVARGSEVNDAGFPSNTTDQARIAAFLTDGINGLNLGSGITNIPRSTTVTLEVAGGVRLGAIGDSIPDILITQIANPEATYQDTLEFRDASNNIVGTSISINQTLIDPISRPSGEKSLSVDYYTIPSAVPGPTASNDVRLRTFRLSEFGITSANRGSVAKLVWIAGGSSDPAFFAYNTASLSFSADDPVPSESSEPDVEPPVSAPALPSEPAIGMDILGATGGPADSIRIDILATGLPPGTPYRLIIRAPERVLLEGVAPDSGVVSQRVSLPADVGEGAWTVVWSAQLEGQQPLVLSRQITLSSDRTVVDTGTTIVGDPGAPRRLAYTGFETAILPWWALAILVGGLLLWAYGYRARKFYEAELQKKGVHEKTPWEILATPIRVSFIPYTPTLDESAPPQQAQSLSECIQDLDRSISYLLGAKLSQMRRQLASPL